jgi:predicted lipoprotein with Yx(FWY)xxD motif
MFTGHVRQLLAAGTLTFALVVAACGGAPARSTSGGSATASPASPALIKTASKSVGGKSQTILVDSKGITLYYYTPDRGGKVTCTAKCAQAWPPLRLSSGTTPTGGSGVTGRLGMVNNPEGGSQVTYNGWPLYYFAKDKDAEDTYGQGVGGNWFVVPPNLPAAS